MSTHYNIMSDILSPEQNFAFDKFKCGKNLFVTGQGGTGKTKLIHNFIQYATANNLNFQVCALTGCASLLLQCNARTIHSWSGIKICKGTQHEVVSSVLRNRKATRSWKAVKILIVDEVSMMSKKMFDVLFEISKAIRPGRVFGGIQVVFTGDFFQLPPVGSPGEPDTEAFCFESENWSTVFSQENHIELKTVFRQADPIYRGILSQIRYGAVDEEGASILANYVNREYSPEEHNGCIPTKLFPTRIKTDFVNNTMFSKLPDPEVTFEFVKMKHCKTFLESGKPISPEIIQLCSKFSEEDIDAELNHLKNNMNGQPILKLKKGAVVMCTVNIDLDGGICNGSQGIVVDIVDGTPIVKFSNGQVRKLQLHFWQSEDYPCFAVGQIPLCLAWALTIHKIQGSTLSLAEMDLGNSIFEYGQTYVALSRLQTLNGLYLSSFRADKIKANPKVVEFYRNFPTQSVMDVSSSEIVFETYAYVPEKTTTKIIKL